MSESFEKMLTDFAIKNMQLGGLPPHHRGETRLLGGEVEALRAELLNMHAELQAQYDALLTAAWDYWHASAPFDSPEGERANDALTALLGGEVEV